MNVVTEDNGDGTYEHTLTTGGGVPLGLAELLRETYALPPTRRQRAWRWVCNMVRWR